MQQRETAASVSSRLLPTRSVILCAAPKFCAPIVVTLKRSLQVRALGGEKHDIVTQHNDGNHNHTRLQVAWEASSFTSLVAIDLYAHNVVIEQ
jgi:hypothetical protein